MFVFMAACLYTGLNEWGGGFECSRSIFIPLLDASLGAMLYYNMF